VPSSWHGSPRGGGSAGSWGLSVGCALLVAGILANGVSPLRWDRGVPDFIGVGGGWFWSFADFEIVIGGTGGLLSLAVGAVLVYVAEKGRANDRHGRTPL
jgi:hypothetical protein